MMYPFMTLNDETEIVHSDMNADGTVKMDFIILHVICRLMK